MPSDDIFEGRKPQISYAQSRGETPTKRSSMKHIETEQERQIRLAPEMAQLIKDTRSYIRIAAPVLGDRRTAETDAFQIRIDEMLLRLGGAEGFEW
jgi:hypothetical protein